MSFSSELFGIEGYAQKQDYVEVLVESTRVGQETICQFKGYMQEMNKGSHLHYHTLRWITHKLDDRFFAIIIVKSILEFVFLFCFISSYVLL